MSFQKVTSDSIEIFTIKTRPFRSFASSSMGVTGSVYVFSRKSPCEKEARNLSSFIDSTHNEVSVNATLDGIRANSRNKTDISSYMEAYLDGVNNQTKSERKNKSLEIVRFTPTNTFTVNTQKKQVIKKILNPYYRTIYPKCNWAYTNYFTLNFFTASNVPNNAALIYPDDPSVINQTSDNNVVTYQPGNFVLPDEWSFDFYINPRYSQDSPNGDFKAGTIMHLSSCYAVSLITGSSKDPGGYSDGFRIQLQLSHSSDVSPSLAIPGDWPNNLTFLSDDNSLLKNNWHHVIIRWGTNNTNNGSGSFLVDGIERGTFCIPSASVAPIVSSNTPSALFIGNYYEGTNNGANSIANFFAADPAEREGLTVLNASTGIEEPNTYALQHQLNAELHDISIKRYYMTNKDANISSSIGPIDGSLYKTVFYLPPFFTKTSPTRKLVGSYGGVLQTPFYAADGTTDDPFNVALSFGVGGHYMNLENFTMDFYSNNWPRLLNLSASELSTSTETLTSNQHLYNVPATSLRNMMILPCDDGNFIPNYDLLKVIGNNQKYTDDLGTHDYSWINLDNLISSDLINQSVNSDSGSFFTSIVGPTPEDPGTESGGSYAILQRTKDNSSNEVSFFDISNLFYGNKISPKSFLVMDSELSATNGKIKITLKDNGEGSLYRADAATKHAEWASVGNIYYNEGLVLVKDPSLVYFGENKFEMNFNGEQNIHVMKINVFVGANEFNSSSNPSFLHVSASGYPNDPDPNFVYITGMNFHDDNFNVIAKTVLAQPILKRKGEKLLIRNRIDF